MTATPESTTADRRWATPADVDAALRSTGYIPDDAISTTVLLAQHLQRPILVEGPAGTGKTELARALSLVTQSTLIRLQCYEGLDEAKALYEWDYKKQLLRIQAQQKPATLTETSTSDRWEAVEDDIFSPAFLIERPLLRSITSDQPTVLLIDEVDRLDVETEALLLEVLSEFQITVPELGTIRATTIPLVVLTSNATRDLSEALKRRCLYLYLDYPDIDRETAILQSRVPEVHDRLVREIARFLQGLRGLDLKKAPSLAEAQDWAHALMFLGRDSLDDETVARTLNILLKNREDLDQAATTVLRRGLRT